MVAPRLAVLLPAYQAEPFLERALASVLAQDYDRFEVVVVDDGSTDRTAALIHRAGASDARVRCITHHHNQGIVAALTTGLAAINVGTEYVARMDADDVMLPGRLAAQVQALDADSRLAALGSRVRMEPPGGGMDSYIDWLNSLCTPADIAGDIYVESPLCHPSVTLRATALRELGGYHDRAWSEDYDLWLRLHHAGWRLGTLDSVFHVWTDHPNRLTRTDSRCTRQALRECRAFYLARWLAGRPCRIWNAGRDGKRLARALEVHGVVITAFVDIDPRKIGGTRRNGVPVIAPRDLRTPRGGAGPIITAVGVKGARAGLRSDLTEMGYAEGVDFVCAA